MMIMPTNSHIELYRFKVQAALYICTSHLQVDIKIQQNGGQLLICSVGS